MLTKKKGILAKIQSSAPQAMSMPDQPMEAVVRKAANGGYIVKPYGGQVQSYNAPEKVYDDMEGVMECLNDHFGKSKGKEY